MQMSYTRRASISIEAKQQRKWCDADRREIFLKSIKYLRALINLVNLESFLPANKSQLRSGFLLLHEQIYINFETFNAVFTTIFFRGCKVHSVCISD